MKDKDRMMVVPRKWGKLMTTRKVIQEEFERKLDQARQDSMRDQLNDLNVDLDVSGEEIASRLQKIQDRHPSFLKDLAYLVEPLAELDDQQRDKPRSQRDKPQLGSTELDQPGQVMEKKRPLTHMNREEIQKTCRRYGLGRTWNDLLVMLNQVNSASSGKLFDKPKT